MNIHLQRNGEDHASYPVDSVRNMVQENQLTLADLGRVEGEDEWRPLSEILSITPPPAMPQTSAPPQPLLKLWNPNAAGLWSVLFGPVFGSTLHFLNWKSIGNKKKATSSLLWIIGLVILTLSLTIYYIQNPNTRSNYYTGLVMLLLWYYSSGKSQITYVKETLHNQYEKKSFIVPIICGCLGFGLLLVIATSSFTASAESVSFNSFSMGTSLPKVDDKKTIELLEKIVVDGTDYTANDFSFEDVSELSYDKKAGIRKGQATLVPKSGDREKFTFSVTWKDKKKDLFWVKIDPASPKPAPPAAALPQVDDQRVLNLLEEILGKITTLTATGFTIEKVTELSYDEKAKIRKGQATLVPKNGDEKKFTFVVQWQDKEATNYLVSIDPVSLNALSLGLKLPAVDDQRTLRLLSQVFIDSTDLNAGDFSIEEVIELSYDPKTEVRRGQAVLVSKDDNREKFTFTVTWKDKKNVLFWVKVEPWKKP